MVPLPRLMKPFLFISDLHLSAERPRINQLFFDFLENIATGAEALYILGDLFEYWAGDDDLATPFHTDVAKHLASLKNTGVPVYLMHGNRDFLIGEAFAKVAGLTLLPDPTQLTLYGTPTLLLHGDTLCTDDTSYLTFRAQVRAPAWQREFLAKPLAERKMIIEKMRHESEREKGSKAAEIMDVNQLTVIGLLREYSYPQLIHGHTHRPALHRHKVDGHTCVRWVLPDWYESGGYLSCDEAGCRAIGL
jgi:UDP-2,3-diacylglucosamine hydrolase